jgi:hypothetical protein
MISNERKWSLFALLADAIIMTSKGQEISCCTIGKERRQATESRSVKQQGQTRSTRRANPRLMVVSLNTNDTSSRDDAENEMKRTWWLR